MSESHLSLSLSLWWLHQLRGLETLPSRKGHFIRKWHEHKSKHFTATAHYEPTRPSCADTSSKRSRSQTKLHTLCV